MVSFLLKKTAIHPMNISQKHLKRHILGFYTETWH